MKLNYNVKGSERKSLAGAVSQILNAPTKYLGAPTFAYEIGGYHIDKSGTLTGEDNLDLEDALHQQGFDADGDNRHYDEPDTYESGLGSMDALDEIPDIDQHNPGRYADPEIPFTPEMQKQIDDYFLNLPMAKEEKEESGLERTSCDNNGDDIPEPDSLVIEMPRSSFSETALDNLRLLVASKERLIKKALGADALPIEVTDEVVRFPWFAGFPQAEDVSAYAHFIGKLSGMAKKQKRVIAKEKDTDNEKYAFRCFLLRLGFIGDEYKAARKILLRNFSGSGAFKGGNPKMQGLVGRINAEAELYDDVMSLQDKEATGDE